jgi:hypothetical protein
MPLALAVADSGASDQDWRRALRSSVVGLSKRPMILAIFAGFGFALLDLQLPDVFARTVQIVATGATPVALFVIGGSLVGLRLGGMLRDVGGVALGKPLIHPLAVFTVLMLLPPIDPAPRTAAELFAAMPMMSIYPVLAQKYHYDGYCAAALLATTVLSFMTISALLWSLSAFLGWTHA